MTLIAHGPPWIPAVVGLSDQESHYCCWWGLKHRRGTRILWGMTTRWGDLTWTRGKSTRVMATVQGRGKVTMWTLTITTDGCHDAAEVVGLV